MTDTQTDELMSLAEATHNALAMAGPSVFSRPQQLLGILMDGTEVESPEMRMLSYNCDEELLAPFSELLDSRQDPLSMLAAGSDKAARLLYEERIVSEGPARNATSDLVRGMALSLGLGGPDGESATSPLAQAVREALDEEQGWQLIATDPKAFCAHVFSRTGRKTPEERVLAYNCDQEYLAPLLGALDRNRDRAGELSLAASRVVQVLVEGRAVSDGAAHLVVDQMAEGIAQYLGISPHGGSTAGRQDQSDRPMPDDQDGGPRSRHSASTPGRTSSWTTSPQFQSSAQQVTASRSSWTSGPSRASQQSWSSGVPASSQPGQAPSSQWAPSHQDAGSQSQQAAAPQWATGAHSRQPSGSQAGSASAVGTAASTGRKSYHPSAPGQPFGYTLVWDSRHSNSIPLERVIEVSETEVVASKAILTIRNVGTATAFIKDVMALGEDTREKRSWQVPYYHGSRPFVILFPGKSITMTFKAKVTDFWNRARRSYQITGFAQPVDVSFIRKDTKPSAQSLNGAILQLVESDMRTSRLSVTLTNLGGSMVHITQAKAFAEVPKSGESWSTLSRGVNAFTSIAPGVSLTLTFNAKMSQFWSAAKRSYEIAGYAD